MTERLRGRAWVQIRQHVLSCEPRCRECLKNDRLSIATEVDHIVPLHKGGSNEFSNLQSLCLTCHETKTRADMGHKPRVTYGADGWPIA